MTMAWAAEILNSSRGRKWRQKLQEILGRRGGTQVATWQAAPGWRIGMRKNEKSYSRWSVTFSIVQRFSDLRPLSDLNAAAECIDFALKLSTMFLLCAIFPLALSPTLGSPAQCIGFWEQTLMVLALRLAELIPPSGPTFLVWYSLLLFSMS